MRNPRLFFCHIPKTGGTSLRRALEGLVWRWQVVPSNYHIRQNHGRYPRLDAALAMAIDRAKTMQIFRGHYHFSSRHYLPGEFRSVVVLRHPVERSISLFRHWMSRYGKSADSLLERLYSGHSIGSDNEMTRYLAGSITLTPDGRHSQESLFVEPIADPDETLQAAFAALNTCNFVGLTNDMSRLRDELCAYTGKQISFPMDNVTQGQEPRFTPQEIAIFERQNQLDLMLYEYAVRKQ